MYLVWATYIPHTYIHISHISTHTHSVSLLLWPCSGGHLHRDLVRDPQLEQVGRRMVANNSVINTLLRNQDC